MTQNNIHKLLEQALNALALPSMKTEQMLEQRDAAIEALNKALVQLTQGCLAEADEIEQYRVQMGGISAAVTGDWREGETVHPDCDSPALHEVAKLYAKFEHYYKLAHPVDAHAPEAGKGV